MQTTRTSNMWFSHDEEYRGRVVFPMFPSDPNSELGVTTFEALTRAAREAGDNAELQILAEHYSMHGVDGSATLPVADVRQFLNESWAAAGKPIRIPGGSGACHRCGSTSRPCICPE